MFPHYNQGSWKQERTSLGPVSSAPSLRRVSLALLNTSWVTSLHITCTEMTPKPVSPVQSSQGWNPISSYPRDTVTYTMSDGQTQTQIQITENLYFLLTVTKLSPKTNKSKQTKHLNATNYLLFLLQITCVFKKPAYKSELKSITLWSPIPASKLTSTLIQTILYIPTTLYYLPLYQGKLPPKILLQTTEKDTNSISAAYKICHSVFFCPRYQLF